MNIPRPLKSLGYSKVMATLGVFIALGGTSYAAVKIDGSDVRDGSLTGKDIRDRSLGRKDLKRSALPRKVVASRGEPGPRGTTGPAGPRGLPGPIQVVTSRGPASQTLGSSPLEIAKVELDAGFWQLSVTGTLKNSVTTINAGECQIRVGGNDLADTALITLAPDVDGPGLDSEVVALQATTFLNGADEVSLICGGQIAGLRILRPSITAVRATDVDDQTVSRL